MNIKQRIDADLKTAMLDGDKKLVMALRTLKSAILYAEVAVGARDHGMSDGDTVTLLQKEVKKRQESAELFEKGGNNEKAEDERQEVELISKYLPVQMNDDELNKLVGSAIDEIGEVSLQNMGSVISLVKDNSDGRVEGGRIAKAVRERLDKK